MSEIYLQQRTVNLRVIFFWKKSRNHIYVKNDKEKLKVFDRNSAYLPTKKVGKNNPKAEQMKGDNLQREKWNQTVDRALVSGVTEQQIIEVKKVQIGRKASQSIRQSGNNPDLFASIILMAIKVLELLIVQIFNKAGKPVQSVAEAPKTPEMKIIPASHLTTKVEEPTEQIPERPKKSTLASKFERLKEIHEKLQQQSNAIYYKEQELENITTEHDECKGILKGKRRKELKEQMEKRESQIESMKRRLTGIVKEYGYPNARTFLEEYRAAKAEYADYKQTSDSWDRKYGKSQKPMSINARLKQYEQEIKQRENNRTQDKKKDRGER